MNFQDFKRNAFRINPFKTVYLNFKYFNFIVAIKFPILICWNVKFKSLSGRIIIDGPVKTGLIIIDDSSSINLRGLLLFKGKARLGKQTQLYISPTGILKMGENFQATGNLKINCNKEIAFGDNCLLAWDIEILDTDFHKIKKAGEVINPDKSIIIADHVWIGCQTTILKGTYIAENIIIGASSLLSGRFNENLSIYAGNPAKLVKTGVTWEA